jgi:hypothetical protein
MRTCIPAQWGGEQCIGELMQEAICNKGDCSVDGEWGQWTRWGTCDQTCGGGIQLRDRQCYKLNTCNYKNLLKNMKEVVGSGIEKIVFMKLILDDLKKREENC